MDSGISLKPLEKSQKINKRMAMFIPDYRVHLHRIFQRTFNWKLFKNFVVFDNFDLDCNTSRKFDRHHMFNVQLTFDAYIK